MTTFLSKPIERSRFIRFAIVGAVGSIVDFGVMNILVNKFYFPLVLAGTISFIAAVISNYTWNRLWTFPDSRSKPMLRQLLEFSLISAIGLAIRIPTLAILEPIFYRLITQIASLQFIHLDVPVKIISNNLTLAITILIVLFWNFFANRYWTFSDID